MISVHVRGGVRPGPGLPRWRAILAVSAAWLVIGLLGWAAAPASGMVTATAAPAGTMSVAPTEVAASGLANLTFSYRLAGPSAGTVKSLIVTLTIPAGWTPPSATAATGTAGFTSVDCPSGPCQLQHVTIADDEITVSLGYLDFGSSFMITYDGIVPSSPADSSFVTTEQFGAHATPENIVPAPSVTICGNGEGRMGVSPAAAAPGPSTLTFTYTAAGCGLLPGSQVRLEVPPGWARPKQAAGAQGSVSASRGAVTVTGRLITVTGAKLAPADQLTIWYSAPIPDSPGLAVFPASESVAAGVTPAPLTASPQFTVLRPVQPPTSPVTTPTTPAGGSSATPARPGTGTMTVSPTIVAAARRTTLTFTYTAPASGLARPSLIVLKVPQGWTRPTPRRGAPGFASASAGRAAVSGRRIRVTGAALAAGQRLTITYHHAAAPGRGGRATFAVRVGHSGATLSTLARSPTVLVTRSVGLVTPAPGPGLPPLLIALAAGLLAAVAASLAAGARVLRRRARPLPGAGVAAVSHSGPPGTLTVRDTEHEPALVVHIEPHPGGAVTRTEQVTP